MKKIFVAMMIFSIVVSSVFAQAATEQAVEEKIVTIIQDANLAEAEWYKQMNADFEAETGIKVDAQFAASTGNDFIQKSRRHLFATLWQCSHNNIKLPAGS